ncbi:MAG TPA: response regulator [Candidatus Tectomicrobia bacterium]|jgi:DNA-binding response OmpR family regulator|nr:response regulator [Candidatus Tectomicrobia bacterium]
MPLPILLVDDEESILFATREYFTALGYRADCARELEEAKALLARTSYAVAIVDLRLTGSAGTEGLALLDYIRQHSSATRVIILTAYGLPETEQEARRRGAEAFLRKCMSLPEVAHVVAALLRRRS